ncbi:HAD family hydrolase [Kaistia dalseonensis]|uniref:Phosphoglycolate phosphatase-like HAD superfamily hydrolase n=1 Tax=Kaistia dalseonensis TaxID=410840 RepID=A0ABU0H968_9HYPH|nr:HAD family hydrolase [Kaistia dalseonensis]MCX5496246.1 HAD family hydrolase [Kaistia dalseonensis]MDQ0438863.1 phosphoglycolate phosphatase-like HAD superfamily hydrolase [Kaistia dalseonensis]
MLNPIRRGINRRSLMAALVVIAGLAAMPFPASAQQDPLPSWNDGAAKQAIIRLVTATTTKDSTDFVEPADRIAVFDQDGTIWAEHPLYSQALFALDRIATMAPQHPEWKDTEPFQSVLANDSAAISKFSEKDWLEIVTVTHSGMSTAEFETLVKDWLPRSSNPILKRPVTDLVYVPMLEVMSYLRANDFRTYIVTGGGQEFVRPYANAVYGIPREQIVGSSTVTNYEYKDGKPVLMREPKMFFVDDGVGKAVGINMFIGKRPLIAFGNSDGDRQMLEWTTAGDGARLGLLVLHDDAVREFAYGPANGLPDTKVGAFSQSLMDEAASRKWTVISMKNDWARIFAEPK